MPYSLLLADDSVTIQRLVSLTFAGQDIDVTVVGDGNHAVALLAHSHPDIVLADVGMPGQSGYDLARHIKTSPMHEDVPVLLLTGAFEPVDQQRAADAGCDGVISKPFEPQAVVSRVKELLARRDDARARRRPAAAPSVPPPAEAARLDDYFEKLDSALSSKAMATAARTPALADTPVDASEPAGGQPPPALVGAFSALLAAEQSGVAPDAFADWLPEEPVSSTLSGPVTIGDDTIDLIVQRVLERLSDRVVRETVSDIASAAAERLVREEIERIKSHIK